MIGCRDRSDEIKIVWENKRAVGVSIPGRFTDGIDDPIGHIEVHLVSGEKTPPMLGSFEDSEADIVFKPLIPFTQGLHYAIMIDSNVVGEISVPKPDNVEAPQLVNIYPSQDTVPENILKFYFHFSNPMKEGVATKHVFLLNGKDTIKEAFLYLQPELWNEERTTLTLWLDPGRVKRDLIPNRRLGAPMAANTKYTVLISPNWPDVYGGVIGQEMLKEFVTTTRDSLSPGPNAWTIITPKAGTKGPLNILFNESLDHELSMNTLKVFDSNDNIIAGDWQTEDEERTIVFVPMKKWSKGLYKLQIESKLEDLAGNNLSRPFDRDVKNNKTINNNDVAMKSFVIE